MCHEIAKEIITNDYQTDKHVFKNIVKKKDANVIESIQLFKNIFILREMSTDVNNKKVVLIGGGGRNGNITNNNENFNETYRDNLLNDNFDKTAELTKGINQNTNLPKKIFEPTNKTVELIEEIDQHTNLQKEIIQLTDKYTELTKVIDKPTNLPKENFQPTNKTSELTYSPNTI